MSDFGHTRDVIGRKHHRCIACYEAIPKGHTLKHFKGRWNDWWQEWRMHPECYAAMDDDDFEDGFDPGSFTRPPNAGAPHDQK